MSNVVGNRSLGVPKLAHVTPTGPWTGRAACRGQNPDLWFCDDQGGSYRQARTICAACPVRAACLAWAVETKTDHGMFGGLAPHERRHLRRSEAGHLGDIEHALWVVLLVVFILVGLRMLGAI